LDPICWLEFSYLQTFVEIHALPDQITSCGSTGPNLSLLLDIGAHYVAQADLELTILLLTCWDAGTYHLARP
jgi:hypothetical protein